MDYCSAESEFIESLDYLTLPVKRSNSFVKDSHLCEELPTRTRLVRDYRKKVSHKTQTSHSLQNCNESIIFNSTKEEIVEYYAFVSSTENSPSSKLLAYLQTEEIPSKIKDQSLIKVTVTPKATKPHKPKVFARRKQSTNRIHGTVSDEDHSIQARNVYLVVSGQKREKHYNIKTTESARLLNNINTLNDDISLEQVKNVRQVIHSLNMDKKRKKGGPVSKEKKGTGSPSKAKETGKKSGKKEDKQRNKDDNGYKNEENNKQPKQARSIVTITGQIGLGHNNQILMRCGVEGREAPANIGFKSYPTCFQNAATFQHTVTQGTQMDMAMTNTQKADKHCRNDKAQFYTENVACLCKNTNELDNAFRNHDQTDRRQCPLVVITVYPNDERCESVKIYKQAGRSSPVNMYEGYTDVNCMQEANQFSAEDKYYLPESETEVAGGSQWQQTRPRSVSKIMREHNLKETRTSYQSKSPRYSKIPISPRSLSQSTSSGQNIKRQENKETNKSAPSAKTTNTPKSPRNESPNKTPIQNLKQQVINKNISKINKNEPKNVKEFDRTPKTRSPRSLSPSSRSPSSQSDQNAKRKEQQNQRKKGTEPKRDYKKSAKEENVTTSAKFTSAGTNTDHTWTKRALVETFTKEVLGQMENKMMMNVRKANANESQVTINIDGKDENYDVLFQQGGRTTDVKVKKTVKRASAGRNDKKEGFGNNKEKLSLINLLDKQNTRVTEYEYESPTTKNEIIIPEIKVRDSIEIGHKRQHSPRLTLDELNFQSCQEKVSDTGSFAPVKHYKGDRCCPVPDALKKDREIRRLLGIDKCKNCNPMSYFKIPDPGRPCRHYHEETRSRSIIVLLTEQVQLLRNQQLPLCESLMNKEATNQYLESRQTHQINFQISPNRKSVGTQYEPEKIALGSPLSKKMILNRNIQVFLQVEKFTEQKPIMLSRKQYHKVKRAIEHTIAKHPKQKLVKSKYSAGALDFRKKERIPTDKDRSNRKPRVSDCESPVFAYEDTAVLFTTDFKTKKEPVRPSVCSGDVHISYSEPLNESSTKVTVGSAYSHSIHTIFRGFRKPRTPNLGTSTCSFYSGNSNEFYDTPAKYLTQATPYKAPLEKPKKPFLRRLMSCLVLRASTPSGAKIALPPKQKASYNSCTVDSYHISTSLAALEMSSSIYDTSESFYSNHSILPINNKIKRGFFGSVRGLLMYGRN